METIIVLLSKHAAALNAVGSQLLEAEKFDEAWDFFTSALDILLQAERAYLWISSAKEVEIPLEECARLLNRTAELLPPCRPSSSSEKKPKVHRRCGNFDDSSFFVFDESISFAPEDEVTASDVAYYKAALFFNIAFVLHKKSNCVEAWSVYRALYFYELSLESCRACPDHPSCLEVTTAALNNKAHIYFSHCEYSRSRMVLDSLLVTMIVTHGRPLKFEEHNSQGVLFNLYMLRMPTAARLA